MFIYQIECDLEIEDAEMSEDAACEDTGNHLSDDDKLGLGKLGLFIIFST